MDVSQSKYAVINEQSPEETASLAITATVNTTNQIVTKFNPLIAKAKAKLKKIRSQETFFRKGQNIKKNFKSEISINFL